MNRHTPADRRDIDHPTDLKFVGPATASVIEGAGFTAEDIAEKTVSFKMLVEAGVNPGVAAKIRRWHSLSWTFDSGDDLDRRSKQVRGLEDDEREWVAASYGSRDDSDAETTTTDPDLEAEAAWAGQTTAADADAADAADANAGSEAPDQPEADEFAAEAEWVAAARKAQDADAESDATTGSSVSEGSGGDSADDADLAAEAAWVQQVSDPAETDGSGDPVAAESAWRERSVSPPVTEIEGIGETYAEKLRQAGVTSVRSLATCSPELVADLTGLDRGRVEKWRDRARERAE